MNPATDPTKAVDFDRGVEATAASPLSGKLAAALDCKTKIVVHIIDTREGFLTEFHRAEDARFFQYAFQAFTGVIVLANDAARVRYEPLLMSMKERGLIPETVHIRAEGGRAVQQVLTDCVYPELKKVGFSTAVVLIGGTSVDQLRAVNVGVDTVISLHHDPIFGKVPDSAKIFEATSWRKVDTILDMAHDAYGKRFTGSELHPATANKAIRPEIRPIEENFHPILAQWISIAETLKRECVVSFAQRALDDPKVEIGDLFQTYCLRIAEIRKLFKTLKGIVEDITCDMDFAVPFPPPLLGESALEKLRQFALGMKTLSGEVHGVSEKQRGRFDSVVATFLEKVNDMLPSEKIPGTGAKSGYVADWSNVTWQSCVQIAELITACGGHPFNPMATHKGISLAPVSAKYLQEQARDGMRFLTVHKDGQVASACLHRPRHTSENRPDTSFLRQIKRDGGYPWAFFEIARPGESARLFEITDRFMELAAIIEGNTNILAVVHPVNITSMLLQLTRGARVLPITDRKPVQYGYSLSGVEVPPGRITNFVVVERELGPISGSDRIERQDAFEATLRIYCGERKGLCNLRDEAVLIELYIRMSEQVKFCNAVIEHRAGLERGGDGVGEHLKALIKLAAYHSDGELADTPDLRLALRKLLPSKRMTERLAQRCSRRIDQLDEYVRKVYGGRSDEVIRLLKRPTAELFAVGLGRRERHN